MKIHTETEMENHNGTTWNRTEMVWKLNDTERNGTKHFVQVKSVSCIWKFKPEFKSKKIFN